MPEVGAVATAVGGAPGPAEPRVLIHTLDQDEGARLQHACATLDCHVTLALDMHVALASAAEDVTDVVFIDAAVGERRVGDIIHAAKQRSPHVAIILLATPAQVEAEPALLMMVGYEYLTRPISEDAVSAETRLRLDQQRVRRVSAALASTLEFRGLLEVLLRLAVQEVGAETASVLMPREAGGPLFLEGALGLPPGVVAQGHAARDDGIADWVFEHGEPLMLQGGFSDLPLSTVADDRAIATAMVVPLIVGHRTVGVLCLARVSDGAEPFTLGQLRAMEIIGSQAAVAIHSAQTHQALLEQEKWRHELEVARALQQHLLPQDLPSLPNLTVSAVNFPARQIGGDFYDVFRLSDSRIGLAIGDVSGKGIPGALLMTQSMKDLRRAVEADVEPGTVLARLNESIAATSARGMFVTLLYVVLDPRAGCLEYANAGHPPMLVFRDGGGAYEYLGRATDPPLGIVPGASFATGTLPIGLGDALLLYTDGVIEAKNPQGEEFGLDRLGLLFSERQTIPGSLTGFVAKSVQAFADTQPPHDDLTLISARLLTDSDT